MAVTRAQKRKMPSTSSLVAGDAVLGVVGSQTAASLVSGRRSKKLQAGMDTMVSLTKKKARAMSRTSSTASSRKSTATRKSTRSTASSKSRKSTGSRRSTATRKSTGSRRSTASRKSTGSRRKPAAAKKPKVCRPKQGTRTHVYKIKDRSGKVISTRRVRDKYVYETVAVTRKYKSGPRTGRTYTTCVKAGGSAAKNTLGTAGCPRGTTLRAYRQKVPVVRNGVKTHRIVDARRCVKARGQLKDCPANQVVVQKPGVGKICVLPKTAAMRGYPVIKAGTLPVRRRPRAAAGTARKAAPRRRSTTSLVMSLAPLRGMPAPTGTHIRF